MVYAIVRSGAGQQKVAVGDVIEIDQVASAAGESVSLPAVLLVDGEQKGTGLFPPYSFIWDTKQVSTGTHAVTVSGIDPSGNAGAATVVVTVERAPVVNDPDPDPMDNDPDPNDNNNGGDGVDNARWGCTASPGRAEGIGLIGFIALAGLLSRRRR